MTWFENGLVRWGFNDIPPTREIEILTAEFCNMFSLFFAPIRLEMHRKAGDVEITLDSIGKIPSVVKQYGHANRPITVLCKSRVRKTNGMIFEELEAPGDGADASIYVGLDDRGSLFVTLQLDSDEWLKDDTDPEWLTVFNNCLKEAVRVLGVAEVVCDCLDPAANELVDENGFSEQMFRRLSSQ
ncbi:MAG: hypothetical protein ACE5QF_08250 [Thermoplasmata archaeon]